MAANQRAMIRMTDDEVATFLVEQRTATMATVGPTGAPHLVAMWYAVIDGDIWFETKAKSQKITNLRRDPRLTCSVEAGLTYDQLRGVSIEGTASVIDDPEAIWELGVKVWERYNGPYSESIRPMVEVMLNNRVAVRLDAERVRSWDHRKLGMDPMPIAGSTAAFLER